MLPLTTSNIVSRINLLTRRIMQTRESKPRKIISVRETIEYQTRVEMVKGGRESQSRKSKDSWIMIVPSKRLQPFTTARSSANLDLHALILDPFGTDADAGKPVR